MRLSGDFIMTIFGYLVFLCLLGPACCSMCRNFMYKANHNNLMRCLDSWKYHRLYKNDPTRFLTDVTVAREICTDPEATISKVQQCVTEKVSPDCDRIHRYWHGTKDKFTFICNNYHEFVHSHKRCRTNRQLIQQVEHCITENYQRLRARENFCQSTNQYLQCTADALSSRCHTHAMKFFMKIFYAELIPEREHLGCEREVAIMHLQPVSGTDGPCLLDDRNSAACGGARFITNYEAVRIESLGTRQRGCAELFLLITAVLRLL